MFPSDISDVILQNHEKNMNFNTENNDHIHHCVISFTSDWLFPTNENKEIVKILNRTNKKVSFTEIVTDKGHDSFLLEETDFYKTISGFLNSNINGRL